MKYTQLELLIKKYGNVRFLDLSKEELENGNN